MEICRACLSSKRGMIPFDDTLVTNYNLLTNLNVKLYDSMPQKLCPKCVVAVKSFIEFRENCVSSETKLLEDIQLVRKPKNENLQTDAEPEIEISLKQEVKYENDYEDVDYIEEEYLNYEDCKLRLPIKIENETKPVLEQTKPIIEKKNSVKIVKTRPKTKVQKIQKSKVIKPKKNAPKTREKINKTWPCGICSKNFEDENTLKSHLETHMTGTECKICYERFNAWHSLLAHRLDHLPQHGRKCHLCNKRYRASMYLEYHFLKEHNDGKKVALKCKACNKEFKNPRRLNSHYNYAHIESKYFCDHCSKGYTSKSALKGHILGRHTDAKPHMCDMCGFRCKLKSNLNIHKTRRHSENKVITCKECDKLFKTQELYESHKCKVRHVMCPDCGIVCTNRKLRSHRRVHEAARHACPRCPARYKTKEALRVHVDRHDNVRRLTCNLCPAKFFSQSVLIKHRRMHTGERPNVCNVCGKAFNGRHNLKVHLKVHGIDAVVKRVKNPEDDLTNIFKSSNSKF
ncbi:zinc finger protein ZFP2-like [Ostrinia nubilalis]|uniref:zinc finger protein ZFP2-like n=1 Tax=Ostrinia nubilalis TaxID=29057 RepID=UPI0030826894